MKKAVARWVRRQGTRYVEKVEKVEKGDRNQGVEAVWFRVRFRVRVRERRHTSGQSEPVEPSEWTRREISFRAAQTGDRSPSHGNRRTLGRK